MNYSIKSGITSTWSQLAGYDRILIHSLVQYLGGLRKVESQQLSAIISLVEIVAECFINTDMKISTKTI